jgi:DNA repair exonuclease SbcCD ATPase subunit
MTPDLLWFIHLGLNQRLFTLGNAQRALERLPAETTLERYARHLIDDGHVSEARRVPELIALAQAKAAEGGDYGTLASIIETLSQPSASRAPFSHSGSDHARSSSLHDPCPNGLDELERMRREFAAKEAELEEARQALHSREAYLEQCELRLLDRAASLQELEISLEQREENVRRAEHRLRQSNSPFAPAIIATLPPLVSRPADEFNE